MKRKSNKLTLERIGPMTRRGIAFRPISSDRSLCQTGPSRFWDSWWIPWCKVLLLPLNVLDIIHYENGFPTFMIVWLSKRRNRLPIICRSTVVKGNGRHLLVGFWFTFVTLACFATKHRSNIIVTTARSNKCTRFQRKLTFLLSRLSMTLRPQNTSGLKFWTLKYRSTTNPKVGNWQDPNLLIHLLISMTTDGLP